MKRTKRNRLGLPTFQNAGTIGDDKKFMKQVVDEFGLVSSIWKDDSGAYFRRQEGLTVNGRFQSMEHTPETEFESLNKKGVEIFNSDKYRDLNFIPENGADVSKEVLWAKGTLPSAKPKAGLDAPNRGNLFTSSGRIYNAKVLPDGSVELSTPQGIALRTYANVQEFESIMKVKLDDITSTEQAPQTNQGGPKDYIDKILDYELKQGGPGGAPLSLAAAFPDVEGIGKGAPAEDRVLARKYIETLDEKYSELGLWPGLKERAVDFAVNSEDPRAALLEAAGKITPEEKLQLYTNGKLDGKKVDKIWDQGFLGLGKIFDDPTFIQKFDQARDRSYQNTNGADANYEATWKPRVHLFDDVQPEVVTQPTVDQTGQSPLSQPGPEQGFYMDPTTGQVVTPVEQPNILGPIGMNQDVQPIQQNVAKPANWTRDPQLDNQINQFNLNPEELDDDGTFEEVTDEENPTVVTPNDLPVVPQTQEVPTNIATIYGKNTYSQPYNQSVQSNQVQKGPNFLQQVGQFLDPSGQFGRGNRNQGQRVNQSTNQQNRFNLNNAINNLTQDNNPHKGIYEDDRELLQQSRGDIKDATQKNIAEIRESNAQRKIDHNNRILNRKADRNVFLKAKQQEMGKTRKYKRFAKEVRDADKLADKIERLQKRHDKKRNRIGAIDGQPKFMNDEILRQQATNQVGGYQIGGKIETKPAVKTVVQPKLPTVYQKQFNKVVNRYATPKVVVTPKPVNTGPRIKENMDKINRHGGYLPTFQKGALINWGTPNGLMTVDKPQSSNVTDVPTNIPTYNWDPNNGDMVAPDYGQYSVPGQTNNKTNTIDSTSNYNPFKLQNYGNRLQENANRAVDTFNVSQQLQQARPNPLIVPEDKSKHQLAQVDYTAANEQENVGRRAIAQNSRGTAGYMGNLQQLAANMVKAKSKIARAAAEKQKQYDSTYAGQQQQYANVVAQAKIRKEMEDKADYAAVKQALSDTVTQHAKGEIERGQLYNAELLTNNQKEYVNQLSNEYKAVTDENGLVSIVFVRNGKVDPQKTAQAQALGKNGTSTTSTTTKTGTFQSGGTTIMYKDGGLKKGLKKRRNRLF